METRKEFKNKESKNGSAAEPAEPIEIEFPIRLEAPPSTPEVPPENLSSVSAALRFEHAYRHEKALKLRALAAERRAMLRVLETEITRLEAEARESEARSKLIASVILEKYKIKQGESWDAESGAITRRPEPEEIK